MEKMLHLKLYCLTQGDTPWNPSSIPDQVADKFYKQVIDTDLNSANTLKLFPYDPANRVCLENQLNIYSSTIVS
jgi:hypothetical protein